MLTYSFSTQSGICLYEQLYEAVKEDIMKGNLQKDYKLPSKRNFAKNLGISTITVETAYAQLAAEGYIYSLPKKGYYVSDVPHTKSAIENYPSFQKDNISPHTSNSSSISDIEQLPSNLLADFTSNQTNPEAFPFSIWTRLMREVMSSSTSLLMKKSPGAGILSLRHAIANHLEQFRGMHISPNQIIIGAGTEYLYGLLIQLLGRDLVYAVEDPGYQKISQVYQSNQVSCIHLPLDNAGLSASALEHSNASILHISPSHHFPTGIIMPISRRYELLEWANAGADRYIIEDDYDSEFRLMGKPIPSLQSIDQNEKIIYMNTFSKSLSSTIRISYMVLPLHLVQKYEESLSFYSCTVSNFEQYTLARFIQNGYFEKHINRMRNYYRNERNLLQKSIESSTLASISDILEEDAGLHFLLKLHSDIDDKSFLSHALKAGIRINSLSEFYHSPHPEATHILILNYSGLDADIIPKAIQKLSEIIENNL